MQPTSVLYDGRAAATPSQLRASALRDARIERIKALAQPDRPMACLSASQRSAMVVEMPKKQEPSAVVIEYIIAPDSMLWCYHLVEAAYSHPCFRRNSQYPSIEEIQVACAQKFGVTRHDMKSARRTANVVKPRQVAMYLCKRLTLKSLPEIGRRFGGRDHTTVLHAERKIKRLVTTDAVLAAECAAIEKQLSW